MTSQPPRRERASSDRAQPAPASQRPSLQNRTISAPPGELYKLDSSKKTMEGGGGIERTLIEEEEIPSQGGGNGVSAAHAGNEVSSRSNFPHVSIAVVGGEKSGKTTFIQSALEMKHPLSSRSTTKKMSLDGMVYVVRLLEVHSSEVSLSNNGKLEWPRLGSDSPATVDGALLLHDASHPATHPETLKMLDIFAAASVPFVLVATKCDIRSPDGPFEASFGRYDILRTSPDSPQKQKMCIAVILRDVFNQKDVLVERRPTSPSTHEWHHTRARSENPTPLLTGAAGGPFSSALGSGVDGYGVDRYPTDSTTSLNLASNAQGPRYARSNSHPVRPHTPPSHLNAHRPLAAVDSSPDKDHNRQQRLHTSWRNSGGSDAFNSFLNMEDETDGPRSAPSSPRSREKASSEGSSNETGFTFDELVDRLVSQPMSKQDSKFASIFLCLYRKFAAPATLLTALINRFERNEKNMTDQLARIADQLRLLNVMAQWVSEYPGDLAFPKTRKRIVDFVSTLERSHFYMFAAKEIGSYLEVKAEDDDVGWAFKDGEAEPSDRHETFFDNSAPSSPPMFLGGFSVADEGDEEEEDPIYSMSALDLSEGIHVQSSKLSATLSNPSAVEKPGTIPGQSFTYMPLDAAQKESEGLELTPRIPLTKMVWRQLMETPDEDFANELTRIDWIMFNTFRPRDLVRHVSLSGIDKDKIVSLKHVNRMIKQFNHVAFFVASIILLRDKPKHRARALEKFMSIAQKLRRLNNYNSLGAVIAGINGTPVHRLNQTRELVPVQTQKGFMRLVILMGTQKSHFAYRLAWDNSFSERIPFLPLHRRDLVAAEEGNKTFIGDNRTRINWRKFEVMGEVVLGIQHSQKTSYPHLHRYDEVTRIILDTKLSGDEETKMSVPTTAKSTYRALLRELPRRSLSSPTPLHKRVRDVYRQPAAGATSNKAAGAEIEEEETWRRLQEAEQFAQYAKAQRMYAMLVDRYNPGSLMDEEERVRLTARRVGLDLPELAGQETGKKE
ncbi:putative Ras guanyl-nucleotide exchange factor RasGEF [Aspergillus lucknowensis]|uniref:Ras guanine nucleotide exchange factor domain-containing protein n=1 Tax=Aspergillus lucknowensis TaxID=176173 RepID=A0ABR4LWD1_9EURO